MVRVRSTLLSFPHSKCHGCKSHQDQDNSRECQELNLRLLGEKRERYLWAVPSPFHQSLCQRSLKQLTWSLASSPRACIASCWRATALVTALRCLQDHHTWLFYLPVVRKEDFHSKLCFGVFQSWSSLNYLAFKWVFRSLLKSSLKFKWVNSGGGLFRIVLNFCLQFEPSSCQIQLHFRDIKCFMGDFNKSRKCWLH